MRPSNLKKRNTKKICMAISMEFPISRFPAVNVSTIPQRSPLRYPGGKTWLIPHIREWLGRTKPNVLVDPFTGGGIVPLTAIMEGLVEHCAMVEIDRDVAAFWRDALYSTDALIQGIAQFQPTLENVSTIELQETSGFRTLVLNRTRNSGILAPGASFVKQGENGKGIQSRWYPETLIRRLSDISNHADRIVFREGDGIHTIESLVHRNDNEALFLDPPYTAGGKRAGSRLYAHSEIDHLRLFDLLADSDMNFLMTYDCSPEIANLVREHRFHAVCVFMHNAHHNTIPELVITREPLFL